MTHRNILIVDDEPIQVRLLEKFIGDMDYNIITMDNGRQAVDFFINKKPFNGIHPSEVAIMLLDLSMPGVDGLSVLRQIANVKGDLQAIVLTAGSDISTAVSALNLGAVDYVIKGEKDLFPRVMASMNSAIERKNLKQQVYNLERKNNHQVSFSDLIGSTLVFIDAINLAKKASNSNVPILIEGESGAGKELLSRAIHGSGSKSGKPFIIVDCESLSAKDNADTILFGCEKSSEHKITERLVGKIREADGGTLFLKNVNALKADTQAKLLKFIKNGIVEPIGSNFEIKVVVRIISSTNQDLEGCVRHSRFREDLYYCLNVFIISVPSLSERGLEDIRMLAENFCRDFTVNENKKIRGLSEEALQMLYKFDWEDNVRQLRSYIFRAVVLCDGEMLRPEHFPQIVNSEIFTKPRKKSEELIKKVGVVDLFNLDGSCKDLEELETEIFTKLLGCFSGNLSEVSKQLKVGRSTIYRKLKLTQ